VPKELLHLLKDKWFSLVHSVSHKHVSDKKVCAAAEGEGGVRKAGWDITWCAGA